VILTNRVGRFPDGGDADVLIVAQPIGYLRDEDAEDPHEQMRQ